MWPFKSKISVRQAVVPIDIEQCFVKHLADARQSLPNKKQELLASPNLASDIQIAVASIVENWSQRNKEKSDGFCLIGSYELSINNEYLSAFCEILKDYCQQIGLTDIAMLDTFSTNPYIRVGYDGITKLAERLETQSSHEANKSVRAYTDD